MAIEIHLNIYHYSDNSMSLSAYLWDNEALRVVGHMGLYEEGAAVFSSLVGLRIKSAIEMYSALHAGIDFKLSIDPGARNELDKRGYLKSIEADFTSASIAA